MKVIGYMPLHYGAEYLKESLEAILPCVERFIILYTPTPCHGTGTNVTCPDSEQKLKDIALNLSDKIEWISDKWYQEGEQRDYIVRHTGGYDMLVTVDSDEVVDTQEMKDAILRASKREERNFGIDGYVNFWRSFNHVCIDGFRPVRIINLRNNNRLQGEEKVTIYHFGTAQSREIMEYKYLIHGHKSELRPNWLKDFYYSDRMNDLHPVSFDLWNAVPYNKKKLPEALKKHENYPKERI